MKFSTTACASCAVESELTSSGVASRRAKASLYFPYAVNMSETSIFRMSGQSGEFRKVNFSRKRIILVTVSGAALYRFSASSSSSSSSSTRSAFSSMERTLSRKSDETSSSTLTPKDSASSSNKSSLYFTGVLGVSSRTGSIFTAAGCLELRRIVLNSRSESPANFRSSSKRMAFIVSVSPCRRNDFFNIRLIPYFSYSSTP